MKRLLCILQFACIIALSCILTSCDEIELKGHIQASSPVIETGNSLIIEWWLDDYSDQVENTMLNDGNGNSWNVDPSGSKDFQPPVTTIYTVTWSARGESMSKSVEVRVVDPPAVTLSVDKTQVPEGSPVVLIWTSENADTVTINQNIGAVELNGTREVIPPLEITTYTISAKGPADQSKATASVMVTTVALPSVSITADKDTIEAGASVTLTWSSTDATSCVIDNNIGPVNLNGTYNVNPTQTTTYAITAEGEGGTASHSVTINVLPEILSFTASPEEVNSGGRVTLSWESRLADSCSISPGPGSVDLSGSVYVYPLNETTYTLSASNSAGVSTKSVIILTKPFTSKTIIYDYDSYGRVKSSNSYIE